MSRHRVSLILVALFVVIHALYFRAGIRFKADTLQDFWQFLDPELLRTRLLESLAWLHIQPPLFNLFLGLVLKGAEHPPTVLHGLYLGMGLALYLGLYALMRELGVSRGVALVTATLFLASPSFILYEHWLYYTFPVALLLVVSTLCLARFLRGGGRGAMAGFVLGVFALCGTWSLFHLLYFVLAIAVAARLRRDHARGLLACAALPFLLVLSLYVKNQVLFGQFTASTWMGMNLWGLIGDQVSLEARQRLVAEGRLSPVALVPRFSELKRYPAASLQSCRSEQVPALVSPYKSNGRPNYNHQAYASLSAQYLRDARVLLWREPLALARGTGTAWRIYFRSATDYGFLPKQPIAAFDEAWNRLFYGMNSARVLSVLSPRADQPNFLFLWVGLPWLVFHGLRTGLGRGPGPRLAPEQRAVTLFLCGNILYVALVGNLFEVGENNRFRFGTDPLFVVLLGLWLQRLGRRALHVTGPAAAVRVEIRPPLRRTVRVSYGGLTPQHGGGNMFERLSNSWRLTKASARVLSADKELVVFPLVSALTLVLVSAGFILPIVLVKSTDRLLGGVGSYVVAFLFYLVSYFVIFFCNSALVGAAMIRLRGGDPTVADGFRIASSKVGSIFGYALIAATVGMVLRALQERAGFIGRIIIGLIGMAWNLATFLVVPVLVVEDVTPVDAVKRSMTLLKKTWGEQVIGGFSVSVVTGLATVMLLIIGLPLIFLAVASQSAVLIGLSVGGLVVAFLLLMLVNATLSGIYTAALYRFAAEGTLGQGFEPEMVEGAFRPKG